MELQRLQIPYFHPDSLVFVTSCVQISNLQKAAAKKDIITSHRPYYNALLAKSKTHVLTWTPTKPLHPSLFRAPENLPAAQFRVLGTARWP